MPRVSHGPHDAETLRQAARGSTNFRAATEPDRSDTEQRARTASCHESQAAPNGMAVLVKVCYVCPT